MTRRRLRSAAPFALPSFVVAVVLGIALAGLLIGRVGARTSEATERLASGLAVSAVQPALRDGDLDGPALSAARTAELSSAVLPAVRVGVLRHLSVLSRDGTVVWSDRAQPAVPARRTHRDPVVTVVVPVTAGAATGAVRVELDDRAGRRAEGRDDVVVVTGVAFALLLMWLVLGWLADRATRALRASVAESSRRARTDSLTGLPNRLAFTTALDQAVARRGPVAVAIVDIDRFKDVNDSFGHRAGDDVLRLVANRLTEVTPHAVLVARLGGDEFAMVGHGPGAEQRLRQVLASLSGLALLMAGIRIQVMSSAGVATSDGADEAGAAAPDVVPGQTLLQRADLAMYAAKRQGVPVESWQPSMAESTALRLEMLSDLRTALADEEIELFVQPVAVPSSGRVAGVETLLRWNHPEHGLLGPDVFVPLAEANELIHELTLWTLERSVELCAGWQAEGRDLHVAVNISPRDLTPSLSVQIDDVLRRHGLPPDRLCIELTETCLPTSMQAARVTLSAIAALGVRVAVDDFGTGFATLSWLRELCFSELKIDRSFVSGLGRGEESAELVRHVIALGHGLGLTVVAEGVETPEQWALLGQLGADLAQGYVIARPMAVGDFLPWCEEWEVPRVVAAVPEQGAPDTGAGVPEAGALRR